MFPLSTTPSWPRLLCVSKATSCPLLPVWIYQWYQPNWVFSVYFIFHLDTPPSSQSCGVHNANINNPQPHFREAERVKVNLCSCVFHLHMRKRFQRGLFIMHKSLLTCLYCNTLFLPLTIQAPFASVGEICPFWIIQSLIAATELHLRNTHAHSRIKRQRGLQGYYNNTSLSPLGEVGILLPSCQKLSDALPYGGHSLLEGNTAYTAGPFRSCLSCAS